MSNLILRCARWALRRRRRVLLVLGLTSLIVLGAHPGAQATDVFNNINPAPQLPPGGWVGRYQLGNYELDEYFPAISVGFTSGVDASGVVPMIAYFGAEVLWEITLFLANGVILLFALAFNLDLVNGNGTPGSGALAPVSQAIHNLYASTFGTPWLIAMVTLVGCWAMWKALVQRRYTETAGALAVSFVFFLLAVGIVTQPERTIGPASKLSNRLSTALLSLGSEGSVGNESQAKSAASSQLFELLVLDPWTVLEFGGVEHCATVSHGKAHSVAVRPLSPNPATDAQLASQLEHGTEVGADGKTCINNRAKYATHFLAYAPGSKERGEEHEALEHGDDEDLPDSDSGKTAGTYPLGPADEPAAEAMGKGGQFQRLLLSIVILLGEVGAFLLLGALALGVILAQILLLTLLAFAPVALLIGIFPGRGHDFFRNWLAKLASYLARKVLYSLILAIVLAVCQALDDATSNLGWLLAFALQAAFLWTVSLQRNKLTAELMAGTVGPRGAREGSNRLANLYYATRLARMMPLAHIPRRSSSEAPPSSGPSGSSGSSGESPAGAEGGTPPPSGGGSPGGGEGAPSAGGGAPSGEEGPPSAGAAQPAHHETPTHGPGARTAGASVDDEDAPHDPAGSTGESPPLDRAPASPDSAPLPRAPKHDEDLELAQPAATTTTAGGSPQPADQSDRAEAPRSTTATPAPDPTGTTTAPPTPVVAASIATTPAAPAPPSPADRPRPPVDAPGVPAPPPAPALPAPALQAQPAPLVSTSASTSREHDEALAAPVPPAIESDEPVAVLLRARQANSPSNPATQEEDPA